MIFLVIILLIGILTTYTDLKVRKIKNVHLILGVVLGVLAIIHTAFYNVQDISYHIINGLAAFLVGFFLFRSNLWRGGDAKLFALYAFLMPLPMSNIPPFASAINLFACSFLGGSLILSPVFLNDIFQNHKEIINELFSVKKRRALFLGIGGMVFFSWVLFPIYYLGNITNPIVILAAQFVIFNWAYNEKPATNEHFSSDFIKKNWIVVPSGLIFGIVTRLKLSPQSLSWQELERYFTHIILAAVITTTMRLIIDHFKNYQDRIPFSPILFLGCLLSYTPFLSNVTRIMVLLNR